MTSKTILITGSTDGIGRAAALLAAEQGHHVIIHGRNPDRLAAAQKEVEKKSGDRVHTLLADLSSLKEVRAAAERLAEELDRLDVLINNAGVISRRRATSRDGYELTFAVNHLAPFLLTTTLLDLLKRSAPARVVTVSSMVHRGARIDFDDLKMERRYDGFTAYEQSKLANVLFTTELTRRLGATGGNNTAGVANSTGVTAVSLHPGVINTKVLHEYFSGGAPVSEGARNVLGPALDEQFTGLTGAYFSGGRPEEPDAAGRDPATARRLWDVSQELCRQALQHIR
jgi:retinol dehydrogenase 14